MSFQSDVEELLSVKYIMAIAMAFGVAMATTENKVEGVMTYFISLIVFLIIIFIIKWFLVYRKHTDGNEKHSQGGYLSTAGVKKPKKYTGTFSRIRELLDG